MVLFEGYGKALVSHPSPLAQIPLVEQVCCSNAYGSNFGLGFMSACDRAKQLLRNGSSLTVVRVRVRAS
jgi:hypothetical protein